MSYTATITIERNGNDQVKVNVTGNYIAGHRGARERSGAQLEPDEPAHMEAENFTIAQTVFAFDDDTNSFTSQVMFREGDTIELTDAELEEADKALEAVWWLANREAIAAQAQGEEEAWRDCP